MGILDLGAPTNKARADEGCQLLWRDDGRLHSLSLNFLSDSRLNKDLGYLVVQPRNDILRHTGGRDKPVPDLDVKTGHARFGDSRHGRKGRESLLAAYAKYTDFASLQKWCDVV